MVDYALTFARSARKELQTLDPQVASRILRRLENLVADPRPAGCRKLRGVGTLWRLRVGDYRVIYSIDDDHGRVDIAAIRHRSDAYR